MMVSKETANRPDKDQPCTWSMSHTPIKKEWLQFEFSLSQLDLRWRDTRRNLPKDSKVDYEASAVQCDSQYVYITSEKIHYLC